MSCPLETIGLTCPVGGMPSRTCFEIVIGMYEEENMRLIDSLEQVAPEWVKNSMGVSAKARARDRELTLLALSFKKAVANTPMLPEDDRAAVIAEIERVLKL